MGATTRPAPAPRGGAAREARRHLQQRRVTSAKGVTPTDDPRTSPGTLHPLVFVHPETGRRALYLGRRRNAFIEGLSLDDSNTLLDEIWSEATRESLTWRHRWRVGDLVLWDNRCTMHRRDAFDPAARRVMHRTQIKASRS